MTAALVLLDAAERFRCVRFEARLSRGACGVRYHGAQERYPMARVRGCRGCPLGALHVQLLPAEALGRGPRKPSATLRAWETSRRAGAGQWIPMPDPRPR